MVCFTYQVISSSQQIRGKERCHCSGVNALVQEWGQEFRFPEPMYVPGGCGGLFVIPASEGRRDSQSKLGVKRSPVSKCWVWSRDAASINKAGEQLNQGWFLTSTSVFMCMSLHTHIITHTHARMHMCTCIPNTHGNRKGAKKKAESEKIQILTFFQNYVIFIQHVWTFACIYKHHMNAVPSEERREY